MARWRFLFPHLLNVTVHTAIRLLVLLKLFFDGCDFRISRLLIVLVTSRARSNWDVGRQSAQRAGARNVDMAGRALHDVFAFATFMAEHHRYALRLELRYERSGGLVTTGTVVASWLLILPMAVETRVMRVGRSLEELVLLCRSVRLWCELRDD